MSAKIPFFDVEGNPHIPFNENNNDSASCKNNNNPAADCDEDDFEDFDEDFVEQLISSQPKRRKTGRKGADASPLFPDASPKVIFKRNKKGFLIPVPVGPRAQDWKEGIQPQSMRSGWIDESDSDNSDVFKMVSKKQVDATFQIYVVIGIIILILATVGSVKMWEMIYGKPKIKENSFDFLNDDDD